MICLSRIIAGAFAVLLTASPVLGAPEQALDKLALEFRDFNDGPLSTSSGSTAVLREGGLYRACIVAKDPVDAMFDASIKTALERLTISTPMTKTQRVRVLKPDGRCLAFRITVSTTEAKDIAQVFLAQATTGGLSRLYEAPFILSQGADGMATAQGPAVVGAGENAPFKVTGVPSGFQPVTYFLARDEAAKVTFDLATLSGTVSHALPQGDRRYQTVTIVLVNQYAKTVRASFLYAADARQGTAPPVARNDPPSPKEPPAPQSGGKPVPLGLVDAKLAMGFPESMADKPLVTGTDFTFTIVDNAFNGLDAWLEAHPEWKAKIKHVSLRKDGARGSGSHGFDVFRVATAVMPMARFLLIEDGGYFEPVLKTMRSNGSYFASMSLGMLRYSGGADLSGDDLFRLTAKYQVTFLVSAGNYREESHVFDHADADGDGVLEFVPATGSAIDDAEGNRIDLGKGLEMRASLGWADKDEPAAFDLQLVGRDGTVVASATRTGKVPVVRLAYRPDASGPMWLRVVDRTPAGGSRPSRLGMIVKGASARHGHFNGLESLGLYAQQDSPFIISVGGFGKNGAGPVPSAFSSIGHTNTGGIGPLVAGPGQLDMGGGEILNGTSFATPFIAAMYSIFADYNVRNVVEATATQSRWAPGIRPEERTRWGIPSAELIFSNRCAKSNRIEDIRHRVEGGKLLIDFLFTRDCMEGLDYFLHAYVSGHVAQKDRLVVERVKAASGKEDLRGWVQKHSAGKMIDREPVRIEIPLEHIPREQMGRRVEIAFRLSTYAQWDPAAIPDAPAYSLTLPPPEPYAGDAQGAAAAALAEASFAKGGFYDAVTLADRALKDKSLPAKAQDRVRQVRSLSAIALDDRKALAGFLQQDADDGHGRSQALGGLGLLTLAVGQVDKAANLFEGCLDGATGMEEVRCLIGYTAARQFAGLQGRDDAARKYGGRIEAITRNKDLPGLALTLFLGTMTPQEFQSAVLPLVRTDPNAVSVVYHAIGLHDLSNRAPDRAANAFRQAGDPGILTVEAVASRQWLTMLAAAKVKRDGAKQ